MPKCNQCQSEWSWKQTIKNMFTLSNKLKCPVCGKVQYLSGKSRKKISALNFAILLPMLLNVIASIHPLFIITFMFMLFFSCLALMPYLTELSNEEEPLW